MNQQHWVEKSNLVGCLALHHHAVHEEGRAMVKWESWKGPKPSSIAEAVGRSENSIDVQRLGRGQMDILRFAG